MFGRKRDVVPQTPISFGWKVGWFAIRAEPSTVVSAIAKKSHDVSWDTAIGRLKSRKPFLTPRIDGWCLLVTPGDTQDVAPLAALLETDVAYFESHRGVGGAAYAWTEQGVLVRAHSQADGQNLTNFGPITDAERAVGIEPIDFDAMQDVPAQQADQEAEDALWERNPDETSVLALASLLTVDPTTLDQREPSVCVAISLRRWR